MLTTWALPIVQFEEMSDEAMVSIERFDITDTPRFNLFGFSSDNVAEPRNEVSPTRGASVSIGVAMLRNWSVLVVAPVPSSLDKGEGDCEYGGSVTMEGGGALTTGEDGSEAMDELVDSVVDRKERRLRSSMAANLTTRGP